MNKLAYPDHVGVHAAFFRMEESDDESRHESTTRNIETDDLTMDDLSNQFSRHSLSTNSISTSIFEQQPTDPKSDPLYCDNNDNDNDDDQSFFGHESDEMGDSLEIEYAHSSFGSTASTQDVNDCLLGRLPSSQANQKSAKTVHEKWNIRFNEFLEFVRENGHAAVPLKYKKNPQLASWVKRQRHQYKLHKEGKPSTMTAHRLQQLNNAGFVWESQKNTWNEKLEYLKEFRAKHGHCNVPAKYKEHKLGTWVKCQRRQYKLYWEGKASAMNPERMLELQRLGFEWEIRTVTPKG